MALNIYHEARNEPPHAQLAVALVTLNRAKQSGQDVCDVIMEADQFSWTAWGIQNQVVTPKGKPKEGLAWDRSKHMALVSFYARDFTGGATHYHADYVAPGWRKRLQYLGKYGTHLFYK